MPSLTFLGAARTVTGSKHLLNIDGQRILFDCGLFQGLKELRQRNWSPLPVPPDSIDAVVLTHAHIDHSGWLPRLIAQGFKGPIYCTAGTADICRLILPDAAHIQEEDARFANKRGYSKHHPAMPLYTKEDAAEALSRLKPCALQDVDHHRSRARRRVHQRRPLAGLVVCARDQATRNKAPLLPGDRRVSCLAVISAATAVPSCRIRHPALKPTSCCSNPPTAIACIPPEDDGEALGEDRARNHHAARQADHSGVCDWPRRRAAVLAVPPRRPEAHADRAHLRGQPNGAQGLDVSTRPTRTSWIPAPTFVGRDISSGSPPSSRPRTRSAWSRRPARPSSLPRAAWPPAAASFITCSPELPSTRNTILFVGFQAAGTRGRQLIEGAQHVKMYGQQVPVKARIAKLNGMSSHADAGEIIGGCGLSRARRRSPTWCTASRRRKRR